MSTYWEFKIDYDRYMNYVKSMSYHDKIRHMDESLDMHFYDQLDVDILEDVIALMMNQIKKVYC